MEDYFAVTGIVSNETRKIRQVPSDTPLGITVSIVLGLIYFGITTALLAEIFKTHTNVTLRLLLVLANIIGGIYTVRKWRAALSSKAFQPKVEHLEV